MQLFGPNLDHLIRLSFLDLSATSVITSRWFLSFKQAVAEAMTVESDSTEGSPRLDTMFWNTRTVGTGPGITFHGTSGNAGDDGGAHSGLVRVTGPVDVTNTATVSNGRGVDLELHTINRRPRLSLGRNRDTSKNSGTLENPKA